MLTRVIGARPLNTGGPLNGAVNAISTLYHLPSKWANVGGRLSKNAGTGLQVKGLVGSRGVIPGSVEVVERNVRVTNNKVGLDLSERRYSFFELYYLR